ncbi:MAG: hypothetical protein ACHQ0Y_01525 [Thermodesulfovibrionales bacterium]
MAKVITYECKECGCEIVVSGTHESPLRPIYCCGIEVAKISSAKNPEKKKTTKRPVPKAVRKVAIKTAAGKPAKKKAPARKKTSRK